MLKNLIHALMITSLLTLGVAEAGERFSFADALSATDFVSDSSQHHSHHDHNTGELTDIPSVVDDHCAECCHLSVQFLLGDILIQESELMRSPDIVVFNIGQLSCHQYPLLRPPIT